MYLPHCCASDLYKAYPVVFTHDITVELAFIQGIVVLTLLIHVSTLVKSYGGLSHILSPQ
jgi:hypothetical protein